MTTDPAKKSSTKHKAAAAFKKFLGMRTHAVSGDVKAAKLSAKSRRHSTASLLGVGASAQPENKMDKTDATPIVSRTMDDVPTSSAPFVRPTLRRALTATSDLTYSAPTVSNPDMSANSDSDESSQKSIPEEGETADVTPTITSMTAAVSSTSVGDSNSTVPAAVSVPVDVPTTTVVDGADTTLSFNEHMVNADEERLKNPPVAPVNKASIDIDPKEVVLPSPKLDTALDVPATSTEVVGAEKGGQVQGPVESKRADSKQVESKQVEAPKEPPKLVTPISNGDSPRSAIAMVGRKVSNKDYMSILPEATPKMKSRSSATVPSMLLPSPPTLTAGDISSILNTALGSVRQQLIQTLTPMQQTMDRIGDRLAALENHNAVTSMRFERIEQRQQVEQVNAGQVTLQMMNTVASMARDQHDLLVRTTQQGNLPVVQGSIVSDSFVSSGIVPEQPHASVQPMKTVRCTVRRSDLSAGVGTETSAPETVQSWQANKYWTDCNLEAETSMSSIPANTVQGPYASSTKSSTENKVAKASPRTVSCIGSTTSTGTDNINSSNNNGTRGGCAQQ